MTPREIIAEAWVITRREKGLRRWGFAAAVFETLRNVQLLLSQIVFWYMFSQGQAVGWLWIGNELYQRAATGAVIALGITVGLIFLLELFIPTLCQGAIIGLAAKSFNKEEPRGGLVLALYNFFPILELHGLFLFSNVVTVFTTCSMLYRYLDGPIRSISIGVTLFVWVLSTVFSFFSSFAEEGVVISKFGVFESIGRSTKLIVSHLGQVMFLLLLLFVISLRIFINAAMVLLIPALTIGLGLLFAQFLPTALSYSIATGISFIALLFLSYFLAYLHVFRQTVWTITYMQLHAQKDLDVIGG